MPFDLCLLTCAFSLSPLPRRFWSLHNATVFIYLFIGQFSLWYAQVSFADKTASNKSRHSPYESEQTDDCKLMKFTWQNRDSPVVAGALEQIASFDRPWEIAYSASFEFYLYSKSQSAFFDLGRLLPAKIYRKNSK